MKTELEFAVENVRQQAYREGYIDAVRNYAVWKNGEQLVGVQQRPLPEVLEEIEKSALPIRYW